MKSVAPPIVTILTDFGAGSGYPAQMKGVLLAELEDVQIVDISHEVPHFDVLAGALLLEACAPRFPVRAVHCAVVDPGVGTARRPLCLIDPAGRRFVGPDNGLFTPFLDGARCFEISDRRTVPAPRSATFHGRDLFAPAAAFLARGGHAEALGPTVTDPLRLEWPEPHESAAALSGVCLVADPFGNLLTSISERHLGEDRRYVEVLVEGRPARFVTTFGEGRAGELVALVGSSGRLEIAVREGSAARLLGATRGAKVVVHFSGR